MDTVDLPFRLDVDAQQRTVFRLAGELDMATVSQLEEALGEHENASEIVFDLRGLSFLDSMGLLSPRASARRRS